SQSKNEKLYRFSHSRIEDPDHNKVSYAAAHADRSLGAAKYLGGSLRGLVNNGSECTHLTVTWIADDDKVPLNSDLVSYVGQNMPHEVAIVRRCKSKEIEYVTDQLRSFSPDGA